MDVPANASTAVDDIPPASVFASSKVCDDGHRREEETAVLDGQAERPPGDSLAVALRVQEGETVYGMAWFPGMTAVEPSSCCFAASSRVRGDVWGVMRGLGEKGPRRCHLTSHTSFHPMQQAHPIHLWDACGGDLRCTYRGYNDVDEVTAAYSVCFSPDGQRLLGGYNKSIAGPRMQEGQMLLRLFSL